MQKYYRSLIRWGSGILVLFCFDRIVKWLSLNEVPDEGWYIIPEVTGMVFQENEGIAYNIPLNSTAVILVTILAIIVLTAAAVRFFRARVLSTVLFLSLIIVGATSNLLDRVLYGYVIDALVATAWPVFNIADVMITAGTAGLVLQLMKKQGALTA